MWYEVKPKDFDLPSDGEPNAYFSIEDHAKIYGMKLWKGNWEIKKIDNVSHLEYIVSKDDLKPVASFKFKTHADKYNVEYLNGKGAVWPNLE